MRTKYVPLIHELQERTVSTATKKRSSNPDLGPQKPIVCKTWDEYHALVKANFKPIRIDHRGLPVYNEAEVEKRFLPPHETW